MFRANESARSRRKSLPNRAHNRPKGWWKKIQNDLIDATITRSFEIEMEGECGNAVGTRGVVGVEHKHRKEAITYWDQSGLQKRRKYRRNRRNIRTLQMNHGYFSEREDGERVMNNRGRYISYNREKENFETGIENRGDYQTSSNSSGYTIFKGDRYIQIKLRNGDLYGPRATIVPCRSVYDFQMRQTVKKRGPILGTGRSAYRNSWPQAVKLSKE